MSNKLHPKSNILQQVALQDQGDPPLHFPASLLQFSPLLQAHEMNEYVNEQVVGHLVVYMLTIIICLCPKFYRRICLVFFKVKIVNKN